MIQPKSFRALEPAGDPADAPPSPVLNPNPNSEAAPQPSNNSRGQRVAATRTKPSNSCRHNDKSRTGEGERERADRGQRDLVAPNSSESSSSPKKRHSSNSTTCSSAASTSSEASQSSRSSTVIGGNLTTDTSSLNSAAVAGAPPASVAKSSRPKCVDELDETSTLSSNEEYQTARVVLGIEEVEEDDRPEREKEEQEHEQAHQARPTTYQDEGQLADRANVTRINIEHSPDTGGSTMQQQASKLADGEAASPLATPLSLRPFKQQVITNSASKGSLSFRMRQNHMLIRSSTSPSHLSQMVGKSPQPIRGKFNGMQLQPADSASQYSLQFKYQGSNHFEIRWQNIRLYAKPKSRVPSFLRDNSLYRALFGPPDDARAGPAMDLGGDPFLPPYSPPLNHYKIPPTIDENSEMNCPNAGRRSAKTSQSLPGSPMVGTLESPLAKATPPPPEVPVQEARCILNSISGQVFSGQMTAILGPSGVGKTSLLNSLTGRNTMDGSGRVSLIGAANSKRMSVVTVPQVDVLPSKLTTWEDLNFTSRLKNPQARFDHERNIARLVKHLHMEKCLHTQIDKLSGGEARRLSIARELLSSPDIMILDEPTSGLDANTCKKIITALRDIVEHSDNILDKPMSIIITIHQPQQEVLQLFHRIYVMAIGGRVVYEGSPQTLLPTLQEQSSLTRIRSSELLNENPAIVAIEVASGEYGPQVIDELALYHERQVYEEFSAFGAQPLDSPLMTPRSSRPNKSPMSLSRFDTRKRLNSFDSSVGRPTPVLAKRQPNSPLPPPFHQLERMSSLTSLSYASTYDAELPEQISKLKVDKRLRRSVVMKSHFLSHTLTLIRRCWLLTTRDMFLMGIRVLGFLLVAGGIVQIFSHALDPNDHQCPHFETEVDDLLSYVGHLRARLAGLLDILRQGNSTHLFFFHVLLCTTMVTSALTGLVFPLQMRMFVREYKNGWYSPASFIMSQTIAEFPADLVGPILTLVIAYPLCHQPDSAYHWRLVAYTVVVFFCSIICKSQAQIVGAFLMDSVENSVFIACVCVTGPALLSGIPLRISQMIPPLQTISYGSFMRYAFESLLELRYGYGMCPCDPELVHGPLQASSQAIPPHLENLATGLLELTLPYRSNITAGALPPDQLINSTSSGGGGALASPLGAPEHENMFIKFLKLITNAANMFTQGTQFDDCSNYRSLYLINMDIAKNTLAKWLPVMVFMFVISRVITYFVVKTVIKVRRS